MKRYLPLVIIGVVLVAVIAGALFLFRSKSQDTAMPFAAGTATPVVSTPVAAPNATPENKITPVATSAVVTVEEFGDYQCPPCGQLHPEIRKIEQEYGTRIHFVFRNLPLTQIHKNALNAAQAAEAARLQDKFHEMHDRLYETQASWKDDPNPRVVFTKYARELGLNVDRFTRDLDGPEVRQKLKEDQDLANSQGVTGTPTVLIEGRQLKVEAINPEGLRKGINVMLARKTSGH